MDKKLVIIPTYNDKENIREIIENHKDESLSDQQISDLLKKEGITIARRTVSKYRRQI